MAVTGLPMGRWRLVCVLQPLQAQSPLELRQGTREEGWFAPWALTARERSPAAGLRRQNWTQCSQAERASREALSSGIKDEHRTWAGRPPGPPAPAQPPPCSPLPRRPGSRGIADPTRPWCRLTPRNQQPRVGSTASCRGHTGWGWLPRAVSAQRAQYRKKEISGLAARHVCKLTSSSLPLAAISRRSRPKPRPAGLSTCSQAPRAQEICHLQGSACPNSRHTPSWARPASYPSGPAPLLPIGEGRGRGVPFPRRSNLWVAGAAGLGSGRFRPSRLSSAIGQRLGH